MMIYGLFVGAFGNEAARRLFDDLLSNYNKLVRPVKNHTQTLQVRVDLKLSQLLDVVTCARSVETAHSDNENLACSMKKSKS